MKLQDNKKQLCDVFIQLMFIYLPNYDIKYDIMKIFLPICLNRGSVQVKKI